MAQRDSIQLLRSDISMQAKSISELTLRIEDVKKQVGDVNNHIADLQIDRAVRVEREKAIERRITSIDGNIEKMYGVTKWALVTFVGAFIVAFVQFVIRGGISP